jgi:hypothetical protein
MTPLYYARARAFPGLLCVALCLLLTSCTPVLPRPAPVPTPLRGEFQMLTPTQTQQKYASVASQGMRFQLEGSEITPGRVPPGNLSTISCITPYVLFILKIFYQSESLEPSCLQGKKYFVIPETMNLSLGHGLLALSFTFLNRLKVVNIYCMLLSRITTAMKRAAPHFILMRHPRSAKFGVRPLSCQHNVAACHPPCWRNRVASRLDHSHGKPELERHLGQFRIPMLRRIRFSNTPRYTFPLAFVFPGGASYVSPYSFVTSASDASWFDVGDVWLGQDVLIKLIVTFNGPARTITIVAP